MIETYLQELPHGITLSCRAAGERGRPVLIFLHGFPEAAFVWDGLLAHFARPENGGYRCIAPNLRGFEKSSRPEDVKQYRAKYLVQDLAALIDIEGSPLHCLIAHDWGGAVAWTLANQHPEMLEKLAIINSPHAATFMRELKNNPRQQAASAYMNFLARPDAAKLLREDGYRRMLGMFDQGAPARWLTEDVKQQYIAVWDESLEGGCAYYAASPLRPPRGDDPGAAAVTLPKEAAMVNVPTLVLWALDDVALLPELVEGLDDYVPDLTLEKIPGASHWIVHEQPALVIDRLTRFLAR